MSLLKISRWKLAVFLVYMVFLGIAVTKHEPWFDESQAWLLARDSTFIGLITRYLRYEGSPGLWHLILMIPAKLSLPFFSLSILSCIIASISVYLFLRYSPFPGYIKLLYPFTFFAFYQYAVIARSYVLLPLLLFLIAICYKKKIDNPFIFTLLLCLLANVSLHGLLISSGLLFAHFIDLIKVWHKLNLPYKKKQLLSFSAFGALFILLVLQLKPPEDIISFAAYNKDMTYFYPMAISMLSDTLTSVTLSGSANKSFQIINQAFPALIIILSLFWFIINKKSVTFLAPSIALSLLFTIIYANVWHEGTLFYSWLFVLWITFEEYDMGNKLVRNTGKLMSYCLALVFIIQVYWSFSSFLYDYNHNYSASREAANYIKDNSLQDKKIYITSFHSISILPYFSRNIFCNYNHGQMPCFWIWSTQNTMYTEPFLSYKNYNPDIIIYGIKNYYSGKSAGEPLPALTGYKLSKVFNGCLYWKDRPYETDSFALYEKK